MIRRLITAARTGPIGTSRCARNGCRFGRSCSSNPGMDEAAHRSPRRQHRLARRLVKTTAGWQIRTFTIGQPTGVLPCAGNCSRSLRLPPCWHTARDCACWHATRQPRIYALSRPHGPRPIAPAAGIMARGPKQMARREIWEQPDMQIGRIRPICRTSPARAVAGDTPVQQRDRRLPGAAGPGVAGRACIYPPPQGEESACAQLRNIPGYRGCSCNHHRAIVRMSLIESTSRVAAVMQWNMQS